MSGWIPDFVARSGYAGILLLMIAENLFPPIPSELVMPLAGFTAARGLLSLPLVVAAGTLGSVIGAVPWYLIGRWLGTGRLERWAERHGRWLTLSAHDIRRAQDAFERHCGKAVLLGRLIPAVRTVISVPAGVARMNVVRFLAFTAAGSLLWNGVLAAAGYALGAEHERVGEYLGPVTSGILILIGAIYIIRVLRWRPAR